MRSAMLIGSSLMVLALVGAEAGCKKSTGNGGGGASTGTTTSKSATSSTGSGSMTTTSQATTVTGATTDAGASTGTAMCKMPLTMVPAPGAAPNTLYCPFGMPSKNCDPSMQHCCETPQGGAPTTCTANATMCAGLGTMGNMDWQCGGPVDCTGGKHCCSNPSAAIAQNMVGGMACPGDFYASKMYQTSCQADCANVPAFTAGGKNYPAGPGLQLCVTDADCTSPMKCQPFRKAGAEVGACQ